MPRFGPVRCAPRLELLEARTVPSTLTVVNNFDHGAGSLRDTIAAANNGDTVVFAPRVHDVTLTSGALAVTKSLDIEGPGAEHLTINGDDASRVFNIGSGASVTLAGLTVANGQAATGGGIDNAGTLTLRDSTVANNQALPNSSSARPNGGGGILNAVGASLVLDHSKVIGNTATASSAATDVFGGGLLNEGTAVVVSSTFWGIGPSVGAAAPSSAAASAAGSTTTAEPV